MQALESTPSRFPVTRLFAGAARALFDVVLPPTCIACCKPVSEKGGLCSKCWSGIGFIERPYCERLGTPFPHDMGGATVSPAAMADPPAWQRARAAARYSDVARDLVHLLKYGDRLDLVQPFGRWMARAGAEILSDADLLVPVPLHWSRLWQRRFNQSAALAQAISTISKTPVADHLLERTRATPPQVGLGKSERAKNVQGAFTVPKSARGDLRARNIVLVDDVLTSGATANACARVLLRGGAKRVDVLVLSRVVDQF